MAQVFLSYNSEDQDFTDLVKMKLEKANIKVWLDRGALRPGNDWRKGIDEGISSSNVLIVIITPRSCDSPYVTYEWAFALGKDKKVIPVIREQANIHPRLEALQYIDFTENRPWESLVKEVVATEIGSQKQNSDSNVSITGSSNLLVALKNEIIFNMQRLEKFNQLDYSVTGQHNSFTIKSTEGVGVQLQYVTCQTSTYENPHIQEAISAPECKLNTLQVQELYGEFRQINDAAKEIQQAMRKGRIEKYLNTIKQFNNHTRPVAQAILDAL